MKTEASRRDWPPRSEKAILLRLRRTGHRGRVRHGSWVTSGGVADILGCPSTRVVKWLSCRHILRILRPKRIGTYRYFDREGWRRLAREYPRLLGGFPVERLYALLEDRELAEQIAGTYRTQVGDFRIRCLETGRVWPNACAAARDLHISRAAISLAIRQRRSVTTLGLTFEALRDAVRG